MFQGALVTLSKQKFSSNVIEKCIRVADIDTKRVLIDELLGCGELEKLIKDSYANYVVQTAMDHSDTEQKAHLHDAIRPIIPQIRNTPCGRRMMSKLTQSEGSGFTTGNSSGNATPQESSPVRGMPMAPSFHRHTGSNGGYQPQVSAFSPANGYATTNGYASNGYGGPNNYGAPNGGYGAPNSGYGAPNGGYGVPHGYAAPNGYAPTMHSPQPHRMSNAALPGQLQASANHQQFSNTYGGFGRGGQANGMNGVNNNMNGMNYF